MLLDLHSSGGGTAREPTKLTAVTRLLLPTLIALGSSLSGCSGAAEIPDTPDLRELQERYDHPTGVLDDAATAATTLGEMPSLHELAAGFHAAGYVQTGVQQGGGDAAQGSSSRFNVQGSIHVNVRCPGDTLEPTFGTNGSVALTIAVEKNQIKRSIGGQATHCVLKGNLLGEPVRVEVDGPLAIDFGKDIGLRNRGAEQLLMNLRGSLNIGGYEVSNLSARWTEERLEYLFVMGDGNWIVAVVTADGTVSIKDKDSTWACSDGQTCSKL